MPKGVWISPSTTTNRTDILTKQILFRENKKKRVYIARRILEAKFKSMQWLVPIPSASLHKVADLQELVSIESWHTRGYWEKYCKLLGYPEQNRRSNDYKNHIGHTLDAVSKFISGIILRWVIYHHLSPFHGYTHIPTEYPALIYDLMEPYRGYIEKCIFDLAKEMRENLTDIENLLPYSISEIKSFLDTEVYVNATRQVVTMHELFHGNVLALRSYLSGNRRFIVPIPGYPNGGRPIKAGYKLYGRGAGNTDFWRETNSIARNFKKKMKLNPSQA